MVDGKIVSIANEENDAGRTAMSRVDEVIVYLSQDGLLVFGVDSEGTIGIKYSFTPHDSTTVVAHGKRHVLNFEDEEYFIPAPFFEGNRALLDLPDGVWECAKECIRKVAPQVALVNMRFDEYQRLIWSLLEREENLRDFFPLSKDLHTFENEELSQIVEEVQ
jgi:hypothetical protein